jgi:hypothetical protein
VIYIINEKPSLESLLSHHGVKGMKWGVRRQLKREARARLSIVGQQMQQRQSYAARSITKEEYDSLSTKPIKLGKDFHRVSDTTALGSIVYATKSLDDHTRYVALFGPGGQRSKVNKKSDISLKTDKQVISPGLKERIDIYIKTLDQKIETDKGLKTGRELAFGGNKLAAALNTRELGLQTYQQFAQSQAIMKTKLQSTYFENVRKKGYNSLLDDADRGFFSNTPLIIFPKESGARVTEVKPITKDDILKAKASLTLLDDPTQNV